MKGNKEKKAIPRANSRLNRREWLAGYLFLLPNFIGFLVFTAVPVVMDRRLS